MAAITYPLLIPDFMKELTLPSYGVSIITAAAENFEVRTLGTELGVGAGMMLEYKNRTAIELNTLMSFYRQTRGSWASFFVPLSIWRQPEVYTNSMQDLLLNTAFKFSQKITVSTDKRDVYNFNVFLESVPVTALPPANTFPSNITS